VILTDGVHLVSDQSLEELHAFAARIGLTRRRFHGVRRRPPHPHYDLKAFRGRALVYGAREVETRDLLRRMVRS